MLNQYIWVSITGRSLVKQRTCRSVFYCCYCYESNWFDPLPVLLKIWSPVNLCLRLDWSDQIPWKRKQLHWIYSTLIMTLRSGFHNPPGEVLKTCVLFVIKYIHTHVMDLLTLVYSKRGHVVTLQLNMSIKVKVFSRPKFKVCVHTEM